MAAATALMPFGTPEVGEPARKPVGGFTFITVHQLALVWWAYSEGHIRMADLRTWFACWELVSRRCELERGQKPEYSLAEVERLTGAVGERAVSASLARLKRAGLLTWSASSIRFSASADAVPGALDGFWSFLDGIENNKRKVPVPRRVVRYIAGGAGRVLTATILGHLFRCLYYRDSKCCPVGNCRASWVAELFGVGLPNVKTARRHLAKLGLFEVIPMPQWHRNRWGARVAVNLAWEGPGDAKSSGGVVSDTPAAETPRRIETRPPGGHFATVSRPPCLNQELSPTSRLKNQKPTSGGPTGVFTREKLGRPSLRHLVSADLKDTSRLLELWERAVEAGRAKTSEHGRLQFVALAEHALAYGSRNPCGLFAWLLAHGKWAFVTQGDEDEANRRLKQHFYPVTPRERAEVMPAKPEPRPLSDLARYVMAVQSVVSKQRLAMEPYFLARQGRPTMTREEWDTGLAELERWHLESVRASHPVEADGEEFVG